MEQYHVIYGLIDPNSKELRYIGYSSEIERRIKDHHRPIYLKAKTYKNNWIKSLIAVGQQAELIIIKEYETAGELPVAEIEMVEYFRALGADLTNGTRGGDGHLKGDKLSDETRKKLSEAFSGEKHPMYGKKHTEEAKQKISEALSGENNPLYGKTHTSETILKMSVIKTGKIFTEEHRENISVSKSGTTNPWYGKKRSETTRKKMSEAQKGKNKLTREQIAAISTDTRPYKIIAADYGVHFKTIANYKK